MQKIAIKLFCRFILAGALLISIFPSASANNFVVGVYGGISYLNVGHSTLKVTSTEKDTLKQTNHVQPLTIGAGFGYKIAVPNNILNNILLSLNVYHFSGTARGKVYQFQIPILDNYRYKLPIDSTRLMADIKLYTKAFYNKIAPFVIGGLGISWNRISYRDHPVPGVPPCTITLASKTDTNFSYELGAGFAVILNQHLNLSAEYLFTNFGTLRSSKLRFRLATHAALFGINWNF